jgi:acetyl/propionyl-CoA carboxylase alpha subunit
MLRALREYVVVGIQTNIPFHQQLLTDERFLAGDFHTGWLEEEFKMASPDGHPDEVAALLVAAVLAHQRKRRPPPVNTAPAANGSAWRSAGRDRLVQGRMQRRWR